MNRGSPWSNFALETTLIQLCVGSVFFVVCVELCSIVKQSSDVQIAVSAVVLRSTNMTPPPCYKNSFVEHLSLYIVLLMRLYHKIYILLFFHLDYCAFGDFHFREFHGEIASLRGLTFGTLTTNPRGFRKWKSPHRDDTWDKVG